MFIELNELYYCRGGYLSRPIMFNINEIAIVRESENTYVDGCSVALKNGKYYSVKEKYDEVISKIVDASVEGKK